MPDEAVRVWEFDRSQDAVAAALAFPRMQPGDVMLVRPERVVGLVGDDFVPVAVSDVAGEFVRIGELRPADREELRDGYPESIELCERIAAGFEPLPPAA